ncbi:MAG: hypothetical protein K8T91_15040, partial [Planctomycetes bacterium]|nr:hypothetical protein [Planctomycetota bacterium]
MMTVALRSPKDSLLGTPPGELVLRVRGTARNGQEVRLSQSRCTVGSAPGCTLRLVAPGIQPQHCLLLRGVRGTIVRSLAAETRLNGRPFDDAALKTGDLLGIGPIEFEVVTAPAPAQVDSAPAELQLKLEELQNRCNLAEAEREHWEQEARDTKRQRDDLRTELASERAVRQLGRDSQQSELAAAKEQLDRNRQELEDAHRALTTRQETLGQQEQALQSQQAALEDERRALREGASLEHSRLDNIEATLAADREELVRTQQDLASEKLTLAAEQERLRSDRNTLQTEQQQLAELRQQLDARKLELDGALAALGDDRQQLGTEQVQLASDRTQLTLQQQQLTAERAHLVPERQEWEAAQAKVADRASVTTQSEEELAAAQAEIAEQRADLDALRVGLDGDRQRLDEQCRQLQSEQNEFAAQQAELVTQRGELASHQEELAIQRQQLTAAQQLAEQMQTKAESLLQQYTAERDELSAHREQLAADREALVIKRQQLSNLATPGEAVMPTVSEPSHEMEEPAADVEQPEVGHRPRRDADEDVFARLRALSLLREGDDKPNVKEVRLPTAATVEPPAVEDRVETLPAKPASPPTDSGSGKHHEGEESIDDYMSQLFARLNGGRTVENRRAVTPPSTAAPAATPSTQTGKVSDDPKPQPTQEFSPPTILKEMPVEQAEPEYLTEMPRRNAPAPQMDLSAMRELANMSANSAIGASQRRRWTSSATIKLGAAAALGVVGITLILFAISGRAGTAKPTLFGFGAVLFVAGALWLLQA